MCESNVVFFCNCPAVGSILPSLPLRFEEQGMTLSPTPSSAWYLSLFLLVFPSPHSRGNKHGSKDQSLKRRVDQPEVTSPWETTVWVERTRRLLPSAAAAAVPLLSLTFRATSVMQRRSDLEEACVCHNVSDGFWFVINRRSVLHCVLFVRRTSFNLTTWQTWEALTACCAPSSYLATEALEAQETRQPLAHNYLWPSVVVKTPVQRAACDAHVHISKDKKCHKYWEWNVKTIYIPRTLFAELSHTKCACVCLSLATVCVCVCV